MQLKIEQYNVICEESLKQYPNEAVFAITKDGIEVLENLHSDPTNYFKVDSKKLKKIKPIALVHSHTVQLNNPRPEFKGKYVDPRVPSKMDMMAQMNLNIPFGIVATEGENVTEVLWFPDLDKELLGREYIANVYDCFELARSWYWQKHQLKIPSNPREYAFWRDSPTEVLDKYKQFGFEDTTDDIKEGDILILRIMGDYTSHIGIYIGNDQFIHHMNDQLSKVETLPRWLPNIVKRLRHKDFT